MNFAELVTKYGLPGALFILVLALGYQGRWRFGREVIDRDAIIAEKNARIAALELKLEQERERAWNLLRAGQIGADIGEKTVQKLAEGGK